MTEQDRPKFAALLAEIMIFYSKTVSSFALDVWWHACQPYGLDAVRKALMLHASDPERGQFAPKPADIVRLFVGNIAEKAEDAWYSLLESVSCYGLDDPYPPADPAAIEALREIGGRSAVCACEKRDLPGMQRRFARFYADALKRRAGQQPALSGGSGCQGLALP